MISEYQDEVSNTTKPDNPQSTSGPKKRSRGGSKPSSTWREKVYKRGDEHQDFHLQAHYIKSTYIFKRDGHTCQACFKTRLKVNREGNFMTCHHIVPRDQGGSDIDQNLITLCSPCHNIIEERNLKSKEEIYGCLTKDTREYKIKSNIAQKHEWRKWVYGGYRKPD